MVFFYSVLTTLGIRTLNFAFDSHDFDFDFYPQLDHQFSLNHIYLVNLIDTLSICKGELKIKCYSNDNMFCFQAISAIVAPTKNW